MQRLSLVEASYIVQPRIEAISMALIALQTATRLPVLLEHKYAAPRLRQQVGTGQSAESASYDDDIVLHAFLRLSHRKMAGWITYDSMTAESKPTSVEKPTERIAGC